uniref:UTP23 small subunit processome component n=1 Tax=Callithrix jacchus TaxID=9483 RepID=A0A8I3W9G5_CALJA
MKITRQKHAKKHLGFFRNNFGVREPYQILLDGTFCQAALRGRIQLREQLPRYLMGETQLCTTRKLDIGFRCEAIKFPNTGVCSTGKGGNNAKSLTEHFSPRQQKKYLKTMKHLLSPFVPSSFFLILITP